MFTGVARSKVPPKQNQLVGEARTTTKEQPVAVCVVDQNRLAARYLLEILAKHSAFHAVTLEEMMMALKPSERIASVFIIDREGIDLPLSECLLVLRERHRKAKFLILDEDEPPEETMRLLALGAHGFVSYAQIDDQLRQAVDRLAHGALWFTSNVLEAYARCSIASLKTSNPSPIGQGITQRESQVIELVKRRLSNKEIATVLNIQESTVKFHLSNAFSKLRVNRRGELQDKGQLGELWRKLIAS
jgi:DNA-binding NarL/FixJ family response regulator